jgi:predicted DNA binding CopG/RHH family protein
MKTVQYFTDEYLENCRKIPIAKRFQFLEDFRQLHGKTQKAASLLISLRIPEDLLRVFRRKCETEGIKYQAKIKELMKTYCG